MTTDTTTLWTNLLASEPGPTSYELAQLGIKNPLFLELVTAELERRATTEDRKRLYDRPSDTDRAIMNLIGAVPDRRVALWQTIVSVLREAEPGDDWLRFFVLCVVTYPELRALAFERLCRSRHNITAYLDETIIKVPELRDQAWVLRKKGGHSDSLCGNNNLTRIIKYLPELAAREAWTMIIGLETRPSYQSVYHVFCVVPFLREEAFITLCACGYLGRCKMNEIFVRSPAYRERAWMQILHHNPTEVRHLPFEVNERLLELVIMAEIPDDLRMRALHELLRRSANVRVGGRFDGQRYTASYEPTCTLDPYAVRVLLETPSEVAREHTWTVFRQSMSIDSLTHVIHCRPELRERAFAELLARPDAPAAAFTSQGVWQDSRLRERGAKAALDHNPTPEVLTSIIEATWVKRATRKRAVRLLAVHQDGHERQVRVLLHAKDLDAASCARLARAILESEKTVPSTMLAAIGKKVPSFLEAVNARMRPQTKDLLAALTNAS